MTSLLVLALLAAAWAGLLLPPYLRNRSTRATSSIMSFRHNLSTLERTAPVPRFHGTLPPTIGRPQPMVTLRSPGVPAGRAEARRRRRDVLFTLVGVVAVTLVLAVALGGLAIGFQLLADVTLGGYLYLLVQLRRSEAERDAKVRFLTPAAAPMEPALVRRRA